MKKTGYSIFSALTTYLRTYPVFSTKFLSEMDKVHKSTDRLPPMGASLVRYDHPFYASDDSYSPSALLPPHDLSGSLRVDRSYPPFSQTPSSAFSPPPPSSYSTSFLPSTYNYMQAMQQRPAFYSESPSWQN